MAEQPLQISGRRRHKLNRLRKRILVECPYDGVDCHIDDGEEYDGLVEDTLNLRRFGTAAIPTLIEILGHWHYDARINPCKLLALNQAKPRRQHPPR